MSPTQRRDAGTPEPRSSQSLEPSWSPRGRGCRGGGPPGPPEQASPCSSTPEGGRERGSAVPHSGDGAQPRPPAPGPLSPPPPPSPAVTSWSRPRCYPGKASGPPLSPAVTSRSRPRPPLIQPPSAVAPVTAPPLGPPPHSHSGSRSPPVPAAPRGGARPRRPPIGRGGKSGCSLASRAARQPAHASAGAPPNSARGKRGPRRRVPGQRRPRRAVRGGRC